MTAALVWSSIWTNNQKSAIPAEATTYAHFFKFGYTASRGLFLADHGFKGRRIIPQGQFIERRGSEWVEYRGRSYIDLQNLWFFEDGSKMLILAMVTAFEGRNGEFISCEENFGISRRICYYWARCLSACYVPRNDLLSNYIVHLLSYHLLGSNAVDPQSLLYQPDRSLKSHKSLEETMEVIEYFIGQGFGKDGSERVITFVANASRNNPALFHRMFGVPPIHERLDQGNII